MTVNDIKVCGGLPMVGFPLPTSKGGRPVPDPAAGNGNDSNLNNPGSNGNYWSSTPNSNNSNNAWNLNFNSSNFNRNNNNRNNGRAFIADSYSCIEGRGTHYGIERLKHHIRSCSQNWSRPCYILKLDVKGYFMHIDRSILLMRCREILAKARERQGEGVFGGADAGFVDCLLEKICLLNPLENCRVVGDTEEWKRLPPEKSLFAAKEGCGLPIGNLSSQLFSNIYLGMLDDFVKRELKVKHYGRYVDDMFIVGESKEEVKAFIAPIRIFLRERLHLEPSENKTRVCDARHGVEFLGAFIKPFRTYVSSQSLRRIRSHLHGVTPRMNIRRAQAVVNSSLGVLSHYDSFNVRKVLVGKSRLSQFGRFSEDGLRYYPNALDWAVYRLKRGGVK